MNKEEKIQQAMIEFRNKIDEIFIGKTPKFQGVDDLLYECDIYLFRHKGMGNSKQVIIANNSLSILTITTSYLETLVRQGITDINGLEDMVEMVKEVLKKE